MSLLFLLGSHWYLQPLVGRGFLYSLADWVTVSLQAEAEPVAETEAEAEVEAELEVEAEVAFEACAPH